MASESPIRWGILGTGRIAGIFAEGLRSLPDAQLVAVGSRAAATAEAFGARYGAPRRHASYAALAADPQVDIVYVATPHTLHRSHALLCLEHGKPVLCEKPFTINAREAEEVVRAAQSRGLLLVEAMWTRFLPAIERAHQEIARGAIGDVRSVIADFGFRAAPDPQSRLFSPALGGGALLDVGVYCISLAVSLIGEPERVAGLADIGGTGVDEQAGVVLAGAGGRLALLFAAIRTSTPHGAVVYGSEGSLTIHAPFWHPTRLTIRRDGSERTIELPYAGNGYTHEAAEAMRCLRAGLTESPLLPHQHTLAVMRTLDRVRQQWGLTYPGE